MPTHYFSNQLFLQIWKKTFSVKWRCFWLFFYFFWKICFLWFAIILLVIYYDSYPIHSHFLIAIVLFLPIIFLAPSCSLKISFFKILFGNDSWWNWRSLASLSWWQEQAKPSTKEAFFPFMEKFITTESLSYSVHRSNSIGLCAPTRSYDPHKQFLVLIAICRHYTKNTHCYAKLVIIFYLVFCCAKLNTRQKLKLEKSFDSKQKVLIPLRICMWDNRAKPKSTELQNNWCLPLTTK